MNIDQFREFVNNFPSNFIVHRYSNGDGGRDYWACLCSAMDWLTEADDALPEFKSRAKQNDAGWIDLYGYLSCVDVIVEATNQLNRCVLGVSGMAKVPSLQFPTRCFVTRPEAFAKLSDRNYFKELRAAFGAHSVNLNDPTAKSAPKHKTPENAPKHEAKRFASWVLSRERGQVSNEFDFSVRLYSNSIGVEDIYLGVKLSELDQFCDQYLNHLESIVAEIKHQYDEFADECRKRPIPRCSNIAEQWNTLVWEARDRGLGSWDDPFVPNVFSVDTKSPKNKRLLVSYRKAICTVIKKMLRAFQNMNDQDIQKVRVLLHQTLSPPYPRKKGLSYCLGKTLAGELPYPVFRNEIEPFFGEQIDFCEITDDVERRVLILAALYELSNNSTIEGK